MEDHGGIISTGENSWFVHQSSLAILPAEFSSSKSGTTGVGNYEFGFRSFFVILRKVTLHTVKFYMGPTALLPLRRKWCHGFLSLLEIYRPRSGLNQRTLGPKASTLTTTPPRTSQKYFLTTLVCWSTWRAVSCHLGIDSYFYLS
jgi:hypothetical protein